jgi:hypothetical protein
MKRFVPDRSSRSHSALRALEEARFGHDRTLNLRTGLPIPEEAVARADKWLRHHQAQRGGEVLIITGRGNQSVGGIPVVRQAILKLISRLKRLGVISSVTENTPGSFIVTLAPMRALLEAPRRHRGRTDASPPAAILPGLDPESQAMLHRLAMHALQRLGVRETQGFLADEMQRQFSLIVAGLPPGLRRDEHVRAALQRAIQECEED